MTTERTGERPVEQRLEDYFAFYMGYLKVLRTSIPEVDIAKFCQECDFLKPDGVCRGNYNNQARYASRQWCGWASVSGVRGEMTSEGFIAYEAESKSK